MLTFAKTHKECRKSVCVICMKKGDQELTENYKSTIPQQIQKDLDFNDERVPLATCISCRSQIGNLCDGKTTVVPKLYHFETILIKPATRFSNVCECLLCQIAKLKGKEKHPFSKFQESEPKLPQQASQNAEKRCTKCLSIIGRGLSHNCTLGTRHENLRKIAAADPVGVEQVCISSFGF